MNTWRLKRVKILAIDTANTIKSISKDLDRKVAWNYVLFVPHGSPVICQARLTFNVLITKLRLVASRPLRERFVQSTRFMKDQATPRGNENQT